MKKKFVPDNKIFSFYFVLFLDIRPEDLRLLKEHPKEHVATKREAWKLEQLFLLLENAISYAQKKGTLAFSLGTINSSIVRPREIFRGAVINKANAIILCHNHLSGDLTPSGEDKTIALRLKEAGKLMGIEDYDDPGRPKK